MIFQHCTIGDIFDVARGGSPRPIDQFITSDPSGINWIMIGDAPEGSKYIFQTKKKIRHEGLVKSRMVHPGDFLLTNSMSFGRPYITKTTGCIHDGWLVLSPKDPQLVCPDYFYHLLASEEFKRLFSQRAAGAVVKNLNTNLVKSVPLSIPKDVGEQRRIATILDKADAIRRKREQALAMADELLKSTFLEMFGDPIEIASDPASRRLEQLVDPKRGISYGIVQRGQEDKNGVPVVRISNIVSNNFDATDIVYASREISSRYRRTILVGGELLLSIRGTVGRVAIAPKEARGFNVSREVAVIPLLPNVDPVFVRAVMLTPSAQRFMTDNVKGVAQKGINLKDVRLLPIPTPSPSKLEQFLRVVHLTNRVRRHLEGPEKLFYALSQRAFRGEF